MDRKGKMYLNGLPDIRLMIDKAIAYDIIQHRDAYFAPAKTQEEINKEWQR